MSSHISTSELGAKLGVRGWGPGNSVSGGRAL